MSEVETLEAEWFVFNSGDKRNQPPSGAISFERIKRGHDVTISVDLNSQPPTVAKFLNFNLNPKKKKILKLAHKIKTSRLLDKIEKYTKKLTEMVSTDFRLIEELDDDLLLYLVMFLKYEQKPKIQIHAIIILRLFIDYSSNKQGVIENITTPVIKDLICSVDCEVLKQALFLVCTMALTIPKPNIDATLKVVVHALSFFICDMAVSEVMYGISKTYAVVCQVYPNLPDVELELVLHSLLKLINYQSSYILPHACFGLVYLCDGRKEMVVGKKYLGPLIDCLVDIIKCYFARDSRVNTIAALTVLGTIVRWGSDDDIKVIIINKGALQILRVLLGSEDMVFVEKACWIISNITAGKENHIMDVIGSGLIDPLFGVVENCKLLGVKKEAAWAISNALYGVCSDQIENLRDSFIEPLWNILKVFCADQQIISFCLEGLIKLNALKVTHKGQLIDSAELRKLLVSLRGSQFQLVDCIEGMEKLKKPRYADNIKRSEDVMIYDVTFTFQEGLQQPDSKILLVYKSLKENMPYDLRDRYKMADQMEVDEPKHIYR